MTKKGISIIICCYNSESRLPKTLEYLAKQVIRKDIPVELIIVNNASTDRTKEIALNEWGQYQTNFLFHIFDEETPGQMYARKRGVQQSQYEYVLFCDDDNRLQSDYLQTAFDLMESNVRTGALGGQGIAVSDAGFPEWFSDFETAYATGKQSNESGDISKRGYLWGAGMIARRDLLTMVFDSNYPLLIEGRTGGKLISGDDSEICKRILLLGYTLHYDSSLLFYHYLPANRLTWAYKKKFFEDFEITYGILDKYDFILLEINKNFFGKMKGILHHILKLLKPGSSKVKSKAELYAKTGLALKNSKISKDLEYKSILRFVLEHHELS